MKRLFTAFVFTAILIGLCFLGYGTVHSKMESFTDLINTIKKTDEQEYDIYYSTAQKCEDSFHKNENLLAFFVNHEKLDELKFSIARLRSYSETENHPYLLVECASAQMIIEDILDDQRFCMHSIF